ncbi:TonB-dependent receptor [Sphingomonas sp. IC4-52]|uniref:TonB-dependent receptor n=1 Tax=Sphingomonas sp. IC4-52 TaxID=2887202 RepID=UPI001D10FE32|nr:TonB-dependent receptor [Sphingomonas sp. IC4-52]MCC2980289.1 TonB-dependent receptor [Sphingomonas sp. IC4-52]
MTRAWFTKASLAALAAAIAPPTLAQEVRGPESPNITAEPRQPEAALATQTATPTPAGLSDIVVTARRVAENLQSVPVAVTVQTAEALQAQSAVRVPDIARLTPGILIGSATSSGTAITINIRGQVQTDILATLDPSVGTYVDGFYWSRAYGLNADLLDIQNAQVLRGPQGTLFGRNTTGGAMLIQTNDPHYRGFSGLVSGTYGRYNEVIGTAVLNLPLVGDKIALRAAVNYTTRDGFFRNEASGKKLGERDGVTARGKLRIDPADNLTLLFSAEYFRTESLSRPYGLLYVAPTSPANIEGALTANPANAALLGAGLPGQIQLLGIGAGYLNDYIGRTRGTNTVSLNEDPVSFAETQTYTGTATLETFFGAVKFIGGYRKIKADSNVDLDGSPARIIRTFGQQDLQSYSGELQATGQMFDDVVDFAAGIFAFHENGRDESTSIALANLSRISGGGILSQTFYIGDVSNRSMGAYAQGTFHVNDRFSIVAGGRYSVEDKNLVSFNQTRDADTGALLSCLITGAEPGTCRAERKAGFDGISYTFGLNYQITPDILAYVKTSKGFRSGGQNLRASGAANAVFVPFGPEIAREHEIGFKSELFDRRVRFNLAAFYNEVSGIQRSTLVSAPINGIPSPTTIVGNAGKARFYGGEAELTVAPVTGLTLAGNASLTRPKYLDYADLTGDRRSESFPGIPEWTFSLAADYETQIGSAGVRAHLDYAWVDDIALYALRTAPTGDPLADTISRDIMTALTRPAGGEMNARLAVTFNDEAVEVAVFGRNILNRRVLGTGLLFDAPLNVAVAQRNDPATYGLSATVKFGAR